MDLSQPSPVSILQAFPASIRKLDLEEAEDYLAFVQRNIARWQSKEQEIRDIIEQRRQALNMSYIDGLPDEVLFHIFLLLVQGEFDPDKYEATTPLYPWNLAATCRRWRQVCLDCPTLWSYFHLSSTHSCPEEYDTLSLLSVYLQLDRSQDTPIFIDATISCECAPQQAKFHALVNHSHRWREVYFPRLLDGENSDAEDAVTLGPLHGLIPPDAQFPLLRSISWEPLTGDEDTPIAKSPLTSCSSLLGMRSVTFYDLAGIDLESGFPWKQLTEINFHRYEGTFSDLLSLMPNLQCLQSIDMNFTGELSEADTASNLEQGSIALPSLTDLTLCRYKSCEMDIEERLLQYLTTPALQHLTYENIADGSMVELVRRSSCSLRTLAIFQHYHLSHVSLLRMQPQLEELTISPSLPEEDDPISCNDLLQKLVYRKGSTGHLCPSLLELSLDAQTFEPSSLIHLVESRMNTDDTSRLKKLHIGYLDEDEQTRDYYKVLFEDRFKKYKKGGFQFTLKFD